MWGHDEEELMDTSDTPWCWFYLADCGRWHQFEESDVSLKSADLERLYLQSSRGVLSSTLSTGRSRIDFSAMLQTDLTTGKQRRIKRDRSHIRSCSCFSSPPVFWENVDLSVPYQLVQLSNESSEYKTVENYVRHDGLLSHPIVALYRIQNVDLWEIFCRKRTQLMRIHGVSQIPERRLFHGTAIRNVDNICKFNFDLRLAGRNAHVYGRGIYFARLASFADKYSPLSTDPLPVQGKELLSGDSRGSKIMFLARVIVGESVLGNSHFRKPDHGKLENTHSSCVDDTSHPKIFVIFDPNQIYPEYLIHYR